MWKHVGVRQEFQASDGTKLVITVQKLRHCWIAFSVFGELIELVDHIGTQEAMGGRNTELVFYKREIHTILRRYLLFFVQKG